MAAFNGYLMCLAIMAFGIFYFLRHRGEAHVTNECSATVTLHPTHIHTHTCVYIKELKLSLQPFGIIKMCHGVHKTVLSSLF